MNKKYSHSYQILDISIWPITISISILTLIISIIISIHNIHSFFNNSLLMILSIINIIISIYCWYKDVIIESLYKGLHTIKVQENIKIGFILFIISEIMIFVSLFYSYLYNSLLSSVELGILYPPKGINSIPYESIPLLNTALLFFSSITITSANNFIKFNKIKTLFLILLTIILNIIFSYLQYIEYINSSFDISDSIYGSNFYTLTSLHGLHVIFGTILLILSFFKLFNNQFSNQHHLLATSSSTYIHFVDIVWLFLFLLLYIYG